ncbi:MAG: PQQ-binding-like beta-propeller repeat protein, partial [Gemmataceae bacterium]|nr:PQQ-binding-like beta-propeller repeat protein [Gemmataceae bacterium]
GPGFPGGGFPGGPGWPGGAGGAFGSMNAHFQTTAPVVVNGKVVFAAPDARAIHCVSIRDGSRVWHSTREEDDLYLGGVFGGKVVIVGRKSTRALNLANGNVLWRIEHGEPSGQGAATNTVAAGDILYFLPIRANAVKEPEILSINLDKGMVHAHTRSRKKEVPGNLVFFEGQVISQNQHEVVAYPQLEVQLARLDKEVKEKPDDPKLLTERGDYRLDKGDLGNAIEDLRKALASKAIDAPTKAKARGKLFEAFTDLFQRDFDRAERYLDEFDDLCKVELGTSTGAERTALIAEGKARRANFLCLVGKGKEAQGKLVEAFNRYLELGQRADGDLIQVVDEPSVKAAPDVWAQGRFEAMVKNAKDAKQKAALEAEIQARWEKDAKGKGTKELRTFVALFGSLFGVGREARFALADKLMEDTDLNSLLEAEQQLSVLRSNDEPAIAARAIEALARLNTRKGLLEDAAFYYRVLGEKYPDVKVDGKPGKEHLDDLATDKRFLPYLGEGVRFTIRSKVKLENEEKPGHFATSFSYALRNLGEPLPFFLRHKLAIKSDWMAPLEITDTTTGEKRVRTLDRTSFQQILSLHPQSPRTRFGFQTLGHTVVIQLGHRVFGIDPLGKEPRILWSRNLSQLPGSDTNPPAWSLNQTDMRDGSITLVYTDGSVQRLASGGSPLAGGVVLLLRKDAMSAIDPVTGRELWTRTDIGPRSHVFGDGQNVYVVGLTESGSAAGTRAFRAYDGVNVKIKDFSPEFDGRQRVSGRIIYSKETPPGGATTVKLYDIVEGKAVWSEKFAPGSLVLETENADLAGAVDAAAGTVRIVSLKQHKEIMTAKLDDPAHAQGAERATLVADPDYVFIAFKKPVAPGKAEATSCLQPNLGLTSAPVNGMVYAFRRSDGKRVWFNPVENAHLTLSGAEDAPALHFTARWHETVPGFGGGSQRSMGKSIAKHNGSMWWMSDKDLPMGMNFHEYTVDQRTGKMELIGGQMKVTLTSRPKEEPKADDSKPDAK